MGLSPGSEFDRLKESDGIVGSVVASHSCLLQIMDLIPAGSNSDCGSNYLVY